MLQSIINEISTQFSGIDYLGLAKSYKGKNYINSKPVLWEDNKGNYFYIVNRTITFTKSKLKSGYAPVYNFDLYLYTNCINDAVIPYYLMKKLPNTISVSSIKFEEVTKGTAVIVPCSYVDNSGCNDTDLCVSCC